MKKKIKNAIFIKTPQYETSLDDLCKNQYKKINELMTLIEKEFNTSMHNHPELRGKILDISNFTLRIPDMISEIISYESKN
jgi:hypothetical protein